MFNGTALITLLRQYSVESELVHQDTHVMAYVKHRWTQSRSTHDLIMLDQDLQTRSGIQTAAMIRQFLTQNGVSFEQQPYVCLLSSNVNH